MTRFQANLKGLNGEFWRKDAERELQEIKADLEAGNITIDEEGVGYNSIGRVLMSDLAEKVALVTDRIDLDATEAARDEEVRISLQNYKPIMDDETLMEMRAAFGEGVVVRDIVTGERITL